MSQEFSLNRILDQSEMDNSPKTDDSEPGSQSGPNISTEYHSTDANLCSYNEKAEDLFNQAQSHPHRFASFSGSQDSDKKFVMAGNLFKLANNWNRAGDAFVEAAKRYAERDGCQYEQADCFSTAANCFRKVKKKNAIPCLEHAAQLYCQLGQFNIAARLLESAGELSEQLELEVEFGQENSATSPSPIDVQTMEAEGFVVVDQSSAEIGNDAVKYYKKAAEYFMNEDSPSSAAACLTKAAIVLADYGMLKKAADEFQNVSKLSKTHSLLEYGSKDHMFKCCLCLSLDHKACAMKADELARLCGHFQNSDEFQLVKEIAKASETGCVDTFDAALKEFTRFNSLDEFVQRRLNEARDGIVKSRGRSLT